MISTNIQVDEKLGALFLDEIAEVPLAMRAKLSVCAGAGA